MPEAGSVDMITVYRFLDLSAVSGSLVYCAALQAHTLVVDLFDSTWPPEVLGQGLGILTSAKVFRAA